MACVSTSKYNYSLQAPFSGREGGRNGCFFLKASREGDRNGCFSLKASPRLIKWSCGKASSLTIRASNSDVTRKGQQVTCNGTATEAHQLLPQKKGKASPAKAHTQVELEDEKRIESLIEEIKGIFQSMNDGETSPSAYDTAWVARIQATNGTHQPHFPQTLEWILENQLEDGSWGEPTFFLLYDRLVCTLACVLTLTIWNSAGPQLSKGLDFLRRRTKDMEHEPTGLRTCGFEIAFQAMLDEARDLGLDLPYDLPFLKEISQLREKKIKRIPIEVMHSVQTTLLYSLEALQDVVQWENILKLQSRDGSFLSSPSATAVVYMKTGNKKCLDFLTFIVRRFGDHAPAQYPIDLLERIWAIDTIQRLGIDHHFRKEISATLDYVYKNSGKEGVSWGRDNPIPDIDDTCMAFRLLRMHGYPISPDVLEHFKDDDGRFICFRGETHTGISDMFNLYRFSQMSFPREQILKEAKAFSKNHLKGCLENNKVEDKWSLKKALLKEVECALTCPWSMSLPRVEARTYILHHYGESDVWIAKDIYKMPYVNNKSYLELAKLDFNWLQNVYCGELDSVLRWWKDLGINFPVFNLRQPKEIYFSIAATLFEQEYSKCRLACTKCNYIEDSLEELFKSHGSIEDLNLICQGVERWDPSIVSALPSHVKAAFMGVYNTLNDIALQATKAQGRDIFPYLHNLRLRQIEVYLSDRVDIGETYVPTMEEYMSHGKASLGVDMRIVPVLFLMGERIQDHVIQQLDSRSKIYDQLCTFMRLFIDVKTFEGRRYNGSRFSAVTCYMKQENCSEKEALEHLGTVIDEAFEELVHEYLKPNRLPHACKRLMFEYSRIMQFFYGTSDSTNSSQRDRIENAIDCLFTPV